MVLGEEEAAPADDDSSEHQQPSNVLLPREELELLLASTREESSSSSSAVVVPLDKNTAAPDNDKGDDGDDGINAASATKENKQASVAPPPAPATTTTTTTNATTDDAETSSHHHHQHHQPESPNQNMNTKNKVVKVVVIKKKKKKKTKQKYKNDTNSNGAAKPANALGLVDELEGFQNARHDINKRVPWFRENPIPPGLYVKHIEADTPHDLDWDDPKAVVAAFAPWKLDNGVALGMRQVPRCLLLEAESITEKLVVVNWWRSLSKDEQAKVCAHDGIHRFYRAPMRSKSPYKFCHGVNIKTPLVLDLDADQARYHHFRMRFQPKKDVVDDADANNTDPAAAAAAAAAAANNAGTEGTAAAAAASTQPVFGAPLVFKSKEHSHHDAPPGFRTFQTCYDLAKHFQLSLDQLYCARIDTEATDGCCAVENCKYPALQQNRHCCALHKQNWWPRKSLEQVQMRRGHLLLGAEYAQRPARSDVPTTREKARFHPMPCQCSQKLCEAIGWSADAARLPKGMELPDCIVPTIHRRDKVRPLRLAPWHFAPQHRFQLPNGTWKLTFGTSSTSNLKNKLSSSPSDGGNKFPVPDYDLQDFLNEPGMVEYQSRKSPFLLPEWVLAMQAVEEGPLSLHEYQYHALVKQRNQLLEGLASRSLEHQELALSHRQASTKLEQMKRTHVHKKSAKRRQQEKANKRVSTVVVPQEEILDAAPAKKRSRTTSMGGLFRPVVPHREEEEEEAQAEDEEGDMSDDDEGGMGGGTSHRGQRVGNMGTIMVGGLSTNAVVATNRTAVPRPLPDGSELMQYPDAGAVHEGAQAMHYLQQHPPAGAHQHPPQQHNLPHHLQHHQQQQQQHHHRHHAQHQQHPQHHVNPFGGHVGVGAGGSSYSFPPQQHHATMPHHHLQQQQQQQQQQQAQPHGQHHHHQQQQQHNSAFYPMVPGGVGAVLLGDNGDGNRNTNTVDNESTNNNSGGGLGNNPTTTINDNNNNNNNNTANLLTGESNNNSTSTTRGRPNNNTTWGGFYGTSGGGYR